jgi:hypothetical protein
LEYREQGENCKGKLREVRLELGMRNQEVETIVYLKKILYYWHPKNRSLSSNFSLRAALK